jgi:hypothetical protein
MGREDVRLERMRDKCGGLDSGRLLATEFVGEMQHRARWRELTVGEEAVAGAALYPLAAVCCPGDKSARNLGEDGGAGLSR